MLKEENLNGINTVATCCDLSLKGNVSGVADHILTTYGKITTTVHKMSPHRIIADNAVIKIKTGIVIPTPGKKYRI